jgi:uncharacterized protein involved in cysteine biosynthesis
MGGALVAALGELRDPRFWGVAAKAVGLTALLLGGSFAGFGWLLGVGEDWSFTLPWIGAVNVGGGVGLTLYALAAMAASAVLMLPVAAAFIGVFLDEIVEAVERRAYPALPPAAPVPFGVQARAAAGLFGAMAAANLLGLVVYVVAAPLAPVVFVALNGWLIGREYFETVALRRLSPAAAKALRRRHALSVFGVGAVTAAALALPLANLFAPLLGVAAVAHLFHKVAREG